MRASECKVAFIQSNISDQEFSKYKGSVDLSEEEEWQTISFRLVAREDEDEIQMKARVVPMASAQCTSVRSAAVPE